MIYLLDTNPCIRYLNGRSESLRQRIDAAGPSQLATCSIVKAELCFGAMKSCDPQQTLSHQRSFLDRLPSWPFDDRAAEAYGRIRAHLEQEGTPIGANDLMIAAIALARDAILVTHNTAEFARVPGLNLEDWETP